MQYLNKKRGFSGLFIQTHLMTILVLTTIALFITMAWALWKLMKSVEKITDRVDGALREIERTAEELQKTNAVVHQIVIRAENAAANVEHVTEGVRKLRKTVDAAAGVLDHVAVPVLGTVAGVL
ncbi:MAG TPA: hypothetical protein VE080_01800, partial [Candidatus Aquicultoraceae bacterium]|nr:hypothetical protein [Candidatus Aquicultoraceae bacterium]